MVRARGPNRLTRLKDEYDSAVPTCEKLAKALKDQLDALVLNENLKLATEPESRIKSIDSVEEKLKRKGRKINSLVDIQDIVGLRYVFLFSEDAELFSKRLSELLVVLEHQDARDRLPVSHFGYRSDHFVVRIPTTWNELPAYEGLGDQTAEIQVRTMAQHLWAVASHVLQYKSEESIPPLLRRSLSRVAALLELADSELSRVRAEKASYEESIPSAAENENALSLSETVKIMREVWPKENIDSREDHEELHKEILAYGITTAERLQSILQSERVSAMNDEKRTLKEFQKDIIEAGDDLEDVEFMPDIDRVRRGVYFTHAGLTRMAIRNYLMEHNLLRSS